MKPLSLASIHLDKMKILVEMVIALLYLNTVTPVVMYYIYDDTNKVAFGAAGRGAAPSNFKYGLTGLQMKHFSRHVKADNARAVDSHFKVKKTSSRTYTAPTDLIQETTEKKESYPKNGPANIVNNVKKEIQPEASTHQNGASAKEISNLVYFRVPISERIPYFEQTNQRPCHLKDGSFDTHSSLEVNVHKTRISTFPQRVKLNNNRQLTAVSIYGPDNHHQKMPTSAVVDKTLQKKSNFVERGTQIMYRVLDEITAQAANRRKNTGAGPGPSPAAGVVTGAGSGPGTGAGAATSTTSKKIKRKVTYENMRKYIGKDNGPDTSRAMKSNEKRLEEFADLLRHPTVQPLGIATKGINHPKRFDKIFALPRQTHMEPLRIGNVNDITNINNYKPYALFYRMTPEIVGRSVKEFVPFMSTLETSMAKQAQNPNVGSIKTKRLSSNYVPVDDPNLSRKGYGLVKYGLHRNYREH